jgi:lysophospholipase L1-like esterase
MGRRRHKERQQPRDTTTQRGNTPPRGAARQPAAPSPLRKIAIRIAAVVAGLLVGVLLTELGLRIFGVAPERYPESQWFVWEDGRYEPAVKGVRAIREASPFGIAMGQYRAGSKLRQVFASNPHGQLDDDNGVEYSINSLGLRGPEIAAEKPPGTFRILGVGDSITFGIGVRDHETYLRKIETALNEQYHDQPRFEVLNSGVQGYNTYDEIVALEKRWLQLSPDLVVIFFYLNDAYSDVLIQNMGQELGVHRKVTPLGRVSRIYDLYAHNRQTGRDRAAVEKLYNDRFFAEAEAALPTSGYDWRKSRAALEYAAGLARKHNFKLTLVILPELYQLDGNYPFAAVHKLVATTGQELGIPTLDLLPTFKGLDPSTLWVHPTDHHPNRDAHALVAKAVDEFLEREKLLPAAERTPISAAP